MFSSALKLADLDDFLTPGQECIKPLLEKSANGENVVKETRPDLIKINKVTDASGKVNEKASVGLYDCLACSGCVTSSEAVLVKRQSAAVFVEALARSNFKIFEVAYQSGFCDSHAVSKDDSGAVSPQRISTSLSSPATVRLPGNLKSLLASGLLLGAAGLEGEDGDEEVLSVMSDRTDIRLVVVSLSSQSLTGMSKYFNAPRVDILEVLKIVLGRLGVSFVLDSSLADALFLRESAAEYKQAEFYDSNNQSCSAKKPDSVRSLPVLTSHCPGWVCYAEKVADPSVLPHMSLVPSALEIQGVLVKCLLPLLWNRAVRNMSGNISHSVISSLFSPQESSPQMRGLYKGWQFWRVQKLRQKLRSRLLLRQLLSECDFTIDTKSPSSWSNTFHVSVQPCYDKKLEAMRPEYKQSQSDIKADSPGSAAVDLILTTQEMCRMVEILNFGEELVKYKNSRDRPNAIDTAPESNLYNFFFVSDWLADLSSERISDKDSHLPNFKASTDNEREKDNLKRREGLGLISRCFCCHQQSGDQQQTLFKSTTAANNQNERFSLFREILFCQEELRKSLGDALGRESGSWRWDILLKKLLSPSAVTLLKHIDENDRNLSKLDNNIILGNSNSKIWTTEFGMMDSSGYANYILNKSLRQINTSSQSETKPGGSSTDEFPVAIKKGRNKDHKLSFLNPSEFFCWTYGFRNLKNLLMDVEASNSRRADNLKNSKKKRLKLAEVMACPDGCLNGAGHQLLLFNGNREGLTSEDKNNNSEKITDIDSLKLAFSNSDDTIIVDPETHWACLLSSEYIRQIFSRRNESSSVAEGCAAGDLETCFERAVEFTNEAIGKLCTDEAKNVKYDPSDYIDSHSFRQVFQMVPKSIAGNVTMSSLKW